jgi:hypothetical protein
MVKAFEDKSEIGFQTQIMKALDELPSRIAFPDRSNKGKLYGLLALWKKVKSIADNRYEAQLKELTANELITDPKSITTAGTHTIGNAGKLAVIVDITQPRREFNLEWFCAQLQKQYKVPASVTRSLYEDAKRPGTAQSRTVKVTEQGVAI